MQPQGAYVSMFEPVSKTNGATASGYVDTIVNGRRAAFASIAITLSASNAVTNKPSVMKLQHSDTTDSTNFSDITGFVGGTSFTVGNQLTNASNVHQFNLDLTGRKRYIQAVVSPVTTQVIAANALLQRIPIEPITATDAGTLNFVSG